MAQRRIMHPAPTTVQGSCVGVRLYARSYARRPAGTDADAGGRVHPRVSVDRRSDLFQDAIGQLATAAALGAMREMILLTKEPKEIDRFKRFWVQGVTVTPQTVLCRPANLNA